MPPAIVNAAYEPTQNSITIPVGILTGAFFKADRPVMMNYGGIGAVIGHEITHGFDDEGSQFDKQGNLVNWWTDITKKNFAIKSKCFIDEYGKIYDPVAQKNVCQGCLSDSVSNFFCVSVERPEHCGREHSRQWWPARSVQRLPELCSQVRTGAANPSSDQLYFGANILLVLCQCKVNQIFLIIRITH